MLSICTQRTGAYGEAYRTVDQWRDAPQYIVRTKHDTCDGEYLRGEYRNHASAANAARRLSRSPGVAHARVYSRTVFLSLDRQREYRDGRLCFSYRNGYPVAR